MPTPRRGRLLAATATASALVTTLLAGALGSQSVAAEPDPDGLRAPASADRGRVDAEVAGQKRLLPDDAKVPSGDFRGNAWLDPAESVADARDLRSVDFYARKKRGYVAVVGKFVATPNAGDTALAVYWGEINANGACQARQLVVGDTKGGAGLWITFDASGDPTGQGDKGVRSTQVGRRVLIEATVPAFKNGKYDCGFGYATSLNGSTAYDGTGYVRFGQVRQHLEQYYGSRFGTTTNSPPHTGRVVGAKNRFTIGIRNSVQGIDTSDVTDVQVRMQGGKNAAVSPSIDKLGTIEIVDDKTARFDLTLKKKTTVRVPWTAVGDYGVTNGAITVHPLGAPMTLGKSLVGRRFWAPTNLDWQRRGVWFVNKRFAYIGFPNGGAPTCTKVTSNGVKKGCVRYTWAAQGKRLTVAGKRATIQGGGFTWQDYRYRPMQTPKAGTRWQTSVTHVNATTSGTLEYLDLYFRLDGTFSSRRTTFARVPKGDGKYQVLKNGHLRLTYKGGKVVNTNVGVLVNGQGRPNPWDVGLFVGNVEYTWD